MSELNDFLKLMAEGKNKDPVAVKTREMKQNIKEDLGDLFSQLSHLKAEDPVTQKNKKLEATVKENIKEDFGSLFAELASLKNRKEEIIQENPQLVEEVLIETKPISTPIGEIPASQQNPAIADLPSIDKYLKSPQFDVPEVDQSTREFDLINKKIKFLEQWIGKINNAGPGGGEVNLRWLDDIDRPTIYDMRFLRYNDSKKKFEFAEVNPHDIVYNTHLVTTPTYLVDSDDYYVGVNYAGPTTITLPTTLVSSGRMIIIKDESGNAETNPITVVGNVDNDAGGFIIQINNGAIQLLYRNGWRIV
jgi:hypothetical protein